MGMRRSQGPLLERVDELAAFDVAVAAAAAGDGTLVVVEAPAGCGKTRLLAAAAARAAEAGMTVLRATGGELETGFPFGVVRQLLERPLRALGDDERARLLDGAAAPAAAVLGLDAGGAEGPATQLDPALRARHGVFWVIAGLAERAPLALVVDDAHWADESSLAALDHLARRLGGLPVLLLVGARPEPEDPRVTEALARLSALSQDRVLHPAPLSPGAAGTLAGAWEGGRELDEATARAVHDATGGNPFLIEQLVIALRAEDRHADPDAVRMLLELRPRTIGRSIVLRLGRRSRDALALATAVALLGLDVTLADGAHVAGLDVAAAGAAADELRTAGILAPGEDALAFAHPIVRSAVLAETGVAQRARLHERAAGLLTGRHAPPERVALHLVECLPSGSAEVFEVLWEAAQSARRSSSPGSAVRILRRALEEPPPPERRAEVLAELGFAEHQAGDSASGAEHLRRAVAGCDDAELRARWMQRLARAVAFSQGPGAGFRLLDGEAARMREDDGELAMGMEALALQGALMDLDSRDEARARLLAHPDLAGKTPGERRMLCLMALSACYAGAGAERVRELARRAFGDGRLVAESTAEGPFISASYAWILADGEAEALERELDAAVEQARELAAVGAFASACGARALQHLRRGRIAEAVADAEATLEALEPIAPGFVRLWCQAFAVRTLVEAEVLRGELDAAEAVLARHDFAGELIDWVPITRILPPRATLRLAQGRTDEALADLATAAERWEREGIDTPSVSWRIGGVGAHLRAGDAAAATAVADAHLASARRWGAPGVLGQALHLRALCEPGGARQLDGLTEATALLAGADLPIAHVQALCDLGMVLRVAGRRREAVERLQEAADRAGELGAGALADRALAELAACGLRPQRRSFSGLDALTPSERRIAEMAAGGLSNREIAQALFVTPKTVENHLGRVYGKLDLDGRRELSAALAPVG